jgi:hypothetical protein
MRRHAERGLRGDQWLGAPVGTSKLRGLVSGDVRAGEVAEPSEADREPGARVRGKYPEALLRGFLRVEQAECGFARADTLPVVAERLVRDSRHELAAHAELRVADLLGRRERIDSKFRLPKASS